MDPSLQWPSDKVRQTFIDYFTKKQGHTFVPSSPTVPYDDPTLLFANSGMTQFKPIFLGTVDPKSPQGQWKRAANSQKCIRAGGKHNDLDDVGKDTYHHTFFEMLGNWSFADYFQQEAIDWAWDILINVFGLDPERVYVTYFRGDEGDGLPADDAAKELWKKYLPENRILPFGKKENFWEMGETGPCGPCSEIHYDRLTGRFAPELVNADSPDLIEIWNLVFMAYNREPSRKLTPLPHKHVDTGMGFERLTSILQDKPSNYDTDVFLPIFAKISEITGAPAYAGLLGDPDYNEPNHPGKDTAYRIVADHIRTLVFALSDGAVPSAEGRGYVLRRILRRAVRAGRHYLKAKDGFFHQLVDIVVEKFGDFYPEIRAKTEQVKAIIKREEEQFQSTLNRGEAKFRQLTRKSQVGDILSANDTFLLYGTYGFPLDLIQIMAEEKGMSVDLQGFAKIKGSQSGGDDDDTTKGLQFALKAAAIDQLKQKGVVGTNDSAKYASDPILEGASVKAIWKGDPENGSWVDSVELGQECGVVLDKTNFYAESGGQLYDCGFLQTDDLNFVVKEVKVYGGFVAHIGSLVGGVLKVGDVVSCSFNNERRLPIMVNHTATHLTNLALRRTLKQASDQRGSVVSDEKFRFDFTSPEALTESEIQKVEDVVSDLIKQDLKVFIQEVSLVEAKKISGVRALFSEAYPDPVRVVSVGADLDEVLKDQANPKWADYAIEFCGGTHLSQTSTVEDYVIVSEEAIRSGERRLQAVTGALARKAREDAQEIEKLFAALKSSTLKGQELNNQYQSFVKSFAAAKIPATKRLQLKQQLTAFENEMKKVAKQELSQKKDESNNLVQNTLNELQQNAQQFVVAVLENSNNKLMSDAAVELSKACKEKLNRDVAFLFLSKDAKKKNVILVANVPQSLIEKGLKANEWVSAVAAALGGKGGGSPKGDIAQGFCNAFDNIDDAVQKAKDFAATKF